MQSSDVKLSSAGKRGRWKRWKGRRRAGWRQERAGAELEVLTYMSQAPKTGPGTKYNSVIVCWTIMKFSRKGWVKIVSQKMKQGLEIEKKKKGTGIRQ